MATPKYDKPIDVGTDPKLKNKEATSISGKIGSTLQDIQGKEPQMPAADKLFPLFPKLPTELRLTVWDMALPGPRIMESTVYIDGDDQLCWCLLPSENPPAMLFVYRESRTVALKHYQPLTEEGIANPMVQYFDAAIDTLFSTSSASYFHFPIDPLTIIAHRIPRLSKLILSDDYYSLNSFHSRSGTNLLAPFLCLRELILLPATPSMTIDNVSIGTLGKVGGPFPRADQWFWVFMAGKYEHMFAELEISVSGWKAPKLLTGQFVKKEQ